MCGSNVRWKTVPEWTASSGESTIANRRCGNKIRASMKLALLAILSSFLIVSHDGVTPQLLWCWNWGGGVCLGFGLDLGLGFECHCGCLVPITDN